MERQSRSRVWARYIISRAFLKQSFPEINVRKERDKKWLPEVEGWVWRKKNVECERTMSRHFVDSSFRRLGVSSTGPLGAFLYYFSLPRPCTNTVSDRCKGYNSTFANILEANLCLCLVPSCHLIPERRLKHLDVVGNEPGWASEQAPQCNAQSTTPWPHLQFICILV